ncbi:redoxin domain-containing protein [Paraglaciecola chathamensis]|uniref:Redoxin domain-containing protein n=1 Tax=Paraglaciecola chathamensis TaxID=368405 RepID=A0ABS0WE60_9ALTE|nr:redoxin domain-containing protein [Paraglaciecola chathamensis]MBJ2136744.1 redoxin domain-containing protein [Paraglaciecola chathamensis]
MSNLFLFTFALLWVLVIALGVVVYALARQVGVLYERVAPAGALAMNQQLKAGDKAPEISVKTLSKEKLLIGKPTQKSTLLFFLSPDCPVCKEYLPVITSLSRAERSHLDVVFVSDGDEPDHHAFIKDKKLENFPYVLSEEVGKKFGVSSLPYATLIDKTGIISSMGLVNSREHIESLLNAQDLNVASIQEFLEKQGNNERTLYKQA